MLRQVLSKVSQNARLRLNAYRQDGLWNRNTAKREAFWLAALPKFAAPGLIPRVIHQVYLARDLPAPLQRNVDALKATNPGWEHRLYDENACQAFIGAHYGQDVLDLYRRIDPRYGAARADLARYLIVYALGGVYLDIKSYFDRPIDSVVSKDDAFVLAQWRNAPDGDNPGFGLHPDLDGVPGGEFQQWHVIGAPMHPFLRAVIARVLATIETYRPWRQGVGRSGVFRVTGPIAYTQAILPIRDRHPHKFYADSSEIGLTFSIGDGYKHMAAFPAHYSLQTAPVVRVPVWVVPAAMIYGRFVGRT